MIAVGLGFALSLRAQTTTNPPTAMLPPVQVQGSNLSIHDVASESDRVGPADQPEWTTRRAFAETDVYVIPSGTFEYNQYYIYSHPKHDEASHLFESEFEVGLPWRTQFDVELNYSVTGGKATYDSTLIELPHALADWGRIPLNPTIVPGWRFNTSEPDAYFFRLLLAEELGRRVHFGANLTFQRQVSGALETSYELNTAVSYVVKNARLTVGAELVVEHEIGRDFVTDEEGEIETEIERTTSVLLGPSVLFKPSRATHLGLVGLFGLTSDAPSAEIYVIFGIDLEPFFRPGAADRDSGINPDELRPVRRGR